MTKLRDRDAEFAAFLEGDSERLRRLAAFLIVLRFYEDMKDAQIAATLDRPIGTIKSDIHRGLAKVAPPRRRGKGIGIKFEDQLTTMFRNADGGIPPRPPVTWAC